MYLKAAMVLVAAVTVAGLSACYESPDVTVYKPGVYKGGKDPLVEKQRSAEQQQILRDRFVLVQQRDE